MKSFFMALLLVVGAVFLTACESDSSLSDKPSSIPTREGNSGDLPWDRPASWEGGLPGMGGVGTPTRY